MDKIKCITFDKEAQGLIPDHIKNRMKRDRADAQLPFKVSKNWGCVKSISEIIEDANFIFIGNTYRNMNPRIVMKNAISELDCIEIDYDRFGVTDGGVTNFNNTWGNSIFDSSKDVIGFILEYLINQGATDLIKKHSQNI